MSRRARCPIGVDVGDGPITAVCASSRTAGLRWAFGSRRPAAWSASGPLSVPLATRPDQSACDDRWAGPRAARIAPLPTDEHLEIGRDVPARSCRHSTQVQIPVDMLPPSPADVFPYLTSLTGVTSFSPTIDVPLLMRSACPEAGRLLRASTHGRTPRHPGMRCRVASPVPAFRDSWRDGLTGT